MSREKKIITRNGIESAIVAVFDEDFRGNVFFTATCRQVAQRLGVSPYYVQRVIEMPQGYARYKEDVLVKNGRGKFIYDAGVGRIFQPLSHGGAKHIDFTFDNMQCCKVCGLVRPAEGWTRPCKGPTEISLR